MAGYAGEWRDSRAESPAGGMTSLGIHAVDMFVNLFGRVSSVDAVSRKVALPFDIDDATGVLMDFEGGQVGYLGTVAATGQLWQVRAFGTKGWGSIYGHDRFDAVKIDGTHKKLRHGTDTSIQGSSLFENSWSALRALVRGTTHIL